MKCNVALFDEQSSCLYLLSNLTTEGMCLAVHLSILAAKAASSLISSATVTSKNERVNQMFAVVP